MDTEINQSIAEKDEQQYLRPLYSPIVPETINQNENSNESNNTENAEASNNGGNELENNSHLQTGEKARNLKEQTPMEADEVEQANGLSIEKIAEKPGKMAEVEDPGIDEANAIDFNMPIAKTLKYTNDKQVSAEESLDSETYMSNGQQLYTQAEAKSASDAFLDGIATPIAPLRPRLRVKSEFSLMLQGPPGGLAKNDSLNNVSNAMDTEISPPPPPLISSSSNSYSVADGIATPRISLEKLNRLRVKSELSMPPAADQYDNEDSSSYTQDVLNEPLVNRDIKREPGEVSANSEEDSDGDEAIPDDYFDDLLHDKLKERIEEAKNNELEEKYSDRLKELQRLKEKALRRKNRKKQRKSKKKSRKRSRSRSVSPGSKTKERNLTDNNENKTNYEIKRSRKEMPSCSNYANQGIVEDDLLGVHAGIKLKLKSV